MRHHALTIGIVEVRHHQKAGRIHADLARICDVLRAGIGLRPVRGNVHAEPAVVVGSLQFHNCDRDG